MDIIQISSLFIIENFMVVNNLVQWGGGKNCIRGMIYGKTEVLNCQDAVMFWHFKQVHGSKRGLTHYIYDWRSKSSGTKKYQSRT
jgi:hypothetical protein